MPDEFADMEEIVEELRSCMLRMTELLARIGRAPQSSETMRLLAFRGMKEILDAFEPLTEEESPPKSPPRICDTCGKKLAPEQKGLYAGGTNWCSKRCWLKAIDKEARGD